MENLDIASQISEIKSTILAKIQAGDGRIDQLQRQCDALDAMLQSGNRVVGGGNRKQLVDYLREVDGLAPMMKTGRGTCYLELTPENAPSVFERKTVISSSAVGAATSGVLEIDRIAGVTVEPRQTLFLRDLLVARPTTLPLVDYVKVLSPLQIASPQVETNVKAENAVTFESKSEPIRTIATFVPVSRQVMDDFGELANFLDTGLRYYCDLAEELQMLFGSGTGVDMSGINTTATSFNTSVLSLSAGWNKIDIVGHAIQQLAIAKQLQPTFVILNPLDYWSMRLQKDGFGRYLLGSPLEDVTPTLFGLNVLITVNMTPGSFLVGTSVPAAVEIRDRMSLQVEISSENSDWFTKNLLCIRAERRSCIITKVPGAFITGSFTSSPA